MRSIDGNQSVRLPVTEVFAAEPHVTRKSALTSVISRSAFWQFRCQGQPSGRHTVVPLELWAQFDPGLAMKIQTHPDA